MVRRQGLSILAILGIVAFAPGFVPVVAADQVSGSFSMGAGFTPTGASDLGGATGIDFSPSGAGGTATVSGAITGNFVGLLVAGDTGTIKDFTFNPFGATITDFFVMPDPANTIHFDLTSISVVLQNDVFLILHGTGIFHVAGFDATPGEWNFTGQTITGSSTFSWSSSSGATPVPEPATLLLTGIGLIGSGYFVRRRKLAGA